MTRAGLRHAAAILVAALCLARLDAWAAPAGTATTYVLTGWTAERGAPSGDIWAMAQDPDGYLWIGTNDGLVRFDGLEFVSWEAAGGAPLPGRAVQVLTTTRDGSLWLGFGDANGPVRIRDGRASAFGTESGFTEGGIRAIAEDREGTVWAGARSGLHRYRDGRWSRVGTDQGLPAATVYSLLVDRRGALWVGSAAGVYRAEPRGSRFTLADARRTFVQSFAEDASGTIWVGHTEAVVSSLSARVVPIAAADVRLPAPGWRLLAAAAGDVWVAALGGGLLQLRHDPGQAPVLERVRYEHIITGPPRALFQDRDRHIWVGMRGGGLLRVSEAAVRSETRLAGVTNDGVRAMTAQPDGSVWVATGHDLNVFRGGMHRAYPFPQTMALHTDARGQVWAATHDGVGRIVDGRFVPLRLPRALRSERVTALTSDASGHLWLCSVDEGVLRLAEDAIDPVAMAPEAGQRACSVAFADAAGRIWLGFTGGGVAVYDDGRFTRYGPEQGLAGGTVMSIYEDHRGAIWIASGSGLSRFANGRFVTADADNGLPGSLVPTLIEDDEGAMWVGVSAGASLARFDPSEFDRVAADAGHRMRYALYDASDGLQGGVHWWSHPSAVRGPDGHLWLVTGTGVAEIDPRRIPDPAAPARPRIVRVTADGRTLPPGRVGLPARTSHVEVAFTALALSSASKLRFRYLLEGIGTGWVETGSRRVVTFDGLRPGDYRLRIAASTGGAWTETDTALLLSVRPPVYRTWPFYAACAVGLAFLGSACWWWRMRAVQRRFALVLEERARVSREIHDTLLQDLGAIRLRLEGITAQVGRADRRAGEALGALHAMVGRCIREARNSIWELRSRPADSRDLVTGFEGLASALRANHGTQVDLSVSGAPWACAQEVEEQLLRIGQEALNNAARHAHAGRVAVSVDYGGDALGVCIADDGAGFPVETVRARDGHWGLRNMQERADSIGADLRIDSEPAHGTTVIVSVPRDRSHANPGALP